ncbi:MAG: dihydrodipicolinate synthase family protein [Candidatus Lokiarchaeota archaeon]|nr:dihydrodipicolinate synthase family protein [Candidatus Lokiarchaeota archaeon]
MQKLKGIFGPIPIFLTKDGSIDFDTNLKISKQLLLTDIDGLFILGTTGEFPYFSMEEKKRYIDMFCENFSQFKPIVCCVSHWSQKKAIELTEYALKNGFKYISALLPQYFPVSEINILEYYRSIRKKIDDYDSSVAFIFYHIPVIQSAVSVKPGVIIQLANEGVIQGVKNSTPDLDHSRKIIENTGKEFSFLCGTETLLLEGFRDGAINTQFDGGIFSGANALPLTYKKLFEATKIADRDNFARLWPLVDEFIAIFDHGLTYLPQITKYAMKKAGYVVSNEINKPLGVIDKKIKKQISEVIHKIQIYWGTNQI